MAPAAYRVELSTTNRAGCKNKECKDAGVKISKGQLRFGTFVTIKDFQSWQWKHWGCVTPKVVGNVKEATEDDPDNLDGYEELPKDLQDKIRKAIEQGHVDDEDWLGDAETNRPGKNGFRTPETKRARKEEMKAQKEEQGAASPSQPPTKKRSHVKDEPDVEGAEENEPMSKKKKVSSKTRKNTTEKTASEGEAQPAKKGRTKLTKVKAEATDEAAVALPPKKRERKSAAAKHIKDQDDESDVLDEIPERSASPPLKRTRASRKAAAGKKIKDEDADDETPGETPESRLVGKKVQVPRKTSTPKAPKASKLDNVDDQPSDAPAPSASVIPKPTRALRKKGKSCRIKNEDSGDDDLNDVLAQSVPKPTKQSGQVEVEAGSEAEMKPEDEAIGVVPEVKKRGNGGVSKAVNGTKFKGAKKTNGGYKQTQNDGNMEKNKPSQKQQNGRATRSRKS